MKPTVTLTLAVFCTLYTLATAASLSRDNAKSILSVTGNDLRNLADEIDTYNQVLTAVLGNSEIQTILKRGPGCGQFGGCAQLKLGQDALLRILADDNSRFGSAGPGKRRRSVDAVAEQRE